MDNLSVLHTFTGTIDEAWFYLISVAIEARGAEIIRMMLKVMDAVRANDSHTVAQCLLKFSDIVQEIGTMLDRMYEKCDPEVFYHKIRPFLAGSKNMTMAGLPNGVFYDEGEGKGKWRQYSGGSNAQSSLIQFLDIALGVEHSPTWNSKAVKVDLKAKHGFLSVCTITTGLISPFNCLRICRTTCQAPTAVSSSTSNPSPISATTLRHPHVPMT
jgi:indoleamine 2,3-dioxygenase